MKSAVGVKDYKVENEKICGCEAGNELAYLLTSVRLASSSIAHLNL